MSRELTPYDEQYYRVDRLTAELLKKANFDKVTNAIYYNDNSYDGNMPDENWNDPNVSDGECYYSAPIIDVALHWLEEKGYKWKDEAGVDIYFNDECICPNYEFLEMIYFENYRRSLDNIFITACCNHIITELTP